MFFSAYCKENTQTKALQGFSAICILLHHVGQKTCAHWLNPKYIVHGLDVFVPIGYYFVGIFLFCSGYGLLKSYRAKQDYLKGFFVRRILPVILAYYSTGFIFLIFRFIMGERLSAPQVIYYITGLQLSNPNTWFVIALPILYAGFYFAFKFCKKEGMAVFVTCMAVFTYYGDNFHANFKVLRRWVCLLSQMLASCSFVFFVFMLGLKIKIGNKVLDFMGKIAFEFYLIHGLFIELFGFNFIDVAPSLYYIRNVTLFVIVIVVLSIPATILLQKFHKWVLGKFGA